MVITRLLFNLKYCHLVRQITTAFLQTMEEYKVVPEVVDTVPAEVVEVVYNGNLKVDLGKVLTPTQVKDEPSVKWNAESGSLYTLCMTDPDAHASVSEVLHWLTINIPGNKLKEGETLAEYVGSGPPKDSGLHRYIFLVYKQPGKLTCDEPIVSNKSKESRLQFKVRNFAKKYNLGEPVAGNFYRAEYDDYVPILHAKMSGK